MCRWPQLQNHKGSHWKWMGNSAFLSHHRIWCEQGFRSSHYTYGDILLATKNSGCPLDHFCPCPSNILCPLVQVCTRIYNSIINQATSVQVTMVRFSFLSFFFFNGNFSYIRFKQRCDHFGSTVTHLWVNIFSSVPERMSRYIKSAVKEIKHSEANCSFKAYSRQLKFKKKWRVSIPYRTSTWTTSHEKKTSKRDSDAKNSM